MIMNRARVTGRHLNTQVLFTALISLYFYYYIMLLLTNCEVHTGKYLDRSFEVRTERRETLRIDTGQNDT